MEAHTVEGIPRVAAERGIYREDNGEEGRKEWGHFSNGSRGSRGINSSDSDSSSSSSGIGSSSREYVM